MDVSAVLSGITGLDAIHQMLLSGEPHAALRRELGALLTGANSLGHCRLRRAQFRPGRKLMAYYDAQVRAERDGSESIRPVAVTWGSHRDGGRRHTAADLASIEAEAMSRGLSTPFRKLAVDTPELRMHVRVSPMDVQFPQLVRACDPVYVRDMVAAHAANYAEAPARQYSITFIRYHPGQRHVLRYDPLDAPERKAIFAKLYWTSEDGGRVFSLAKQIRAWLTQNGKGVTSVQPLAWVADDAIILYAQVVGSPLAEQLQFSSQNLANLLEGAGAALSSLHQLPRELAGPLELHDFVAEIEETARASKHVSALLPSAAAGIKALLDRAREMNEVLPRESPAFTHGDFKAEHVWVTHEGLSLIDFDSCHLGDPALDIGKFFADLRACYPDNDQQGLKQAQEQFLAGYGSGGLTERLMRARLYEAVELVKMTVRRVQMFEDDWAPKTMHLIGCAHGVLSDFQRTLGLSVK